MQKQKTHIRYVVSACAVAMLAIQFFFVTPVFAQTPPDPAPGDPRCTELYPDDVAQRVQCNLNVRAGRLPNGDQIPDPPNPPPAQNTTPPNPPPAQTSPPPEQNQTPPPDANAQKEAMIAECVAGGRSEATCRADLNPVIGKPVFEVELQVPFDRVPKWEEIKKSREELKDGKSCSDQTKAYCCQMTKNPKTGKDVQALCYDQRDAIETYGNAYRVHFDKNGKAQKIYQVVRGTDGADILQTYAKYLYTFLASIVGILATLMAVFGGIEMATAGADEAGFTSGKERIIAALAGIALLFIASLVLYTINPTFFTL